MKYDLAGFIVPNVPCIGSSNVKGIETIHYSIETNLYSQLPFFLNDALTKFNVFSSYQTSVFNFLSLDKLSSSDEKLKCNVLYVLSPILIFS